MSKVILHNARCGSTYLYLVLDRYYRAKEGDNSEGSFNSIYDREYNLNNCNYIGLNDFLVPELIKTKFDENKLIVNGIKRKRGDKGFFSRQSFDNKEKKERRSFLDKILRTHFVLLKYPLLTNPKPTWNVEYISCERKDIRKQTESLYLSILTGFYHFKKNDKKVKKLKKFTIQTNELDKQTLITEKLWQEYRKNKPKNCLTLFMEDFENLKPYEVLELVGIYDWQKYLNKDFDIPIGKGWSQ